jgi:hypothetical protein
LLDTAAPDDLKRLSDYHHASAAANIRAQTDLGNVEQARRVRAASDQQAGLLRSIELEAERRLASRDPRLSVFLEQHIERLTHRLLLRDRTWQK